MDAENESDEPVMKNTDSCFSGLDCFCGSQILASEQVVRRITPEQIVYDHDEDEYLVSSGAFGDSAGQPLQVHLLSKTTADELVKIDPDCSLAALSVGFLRHEDQKICDWPEEESSAVVCGDKQPERQQRFAEESEWVDGGRRFLC